MPQCPPHTHTLKKQQLGDLYESGAYNPLTNHNDGGNDIFFGCTFSKK